MFVCLLIVVSDVDYVDVYVFCFIGVGCYVLDFEDLVVDVYLFVDVLIDVVGVVLEIEFECCCLFCF